MKLFLKYIKSKKKIIILSVIFTVILCLSFLFYHLPLRAVVYPIVLCVFIGILFMIFDYTKVKRLHETLQNIKKLGSATVSDLPQYSSLLQQDYYDVISALRDEVMLKEEHFNEKYRDMSEYYSVWAHQIKTPIASMKLTLQGADSQEARKLMSELMRIERYVEMVLAFIRLDSTSTDYVFREYDVDTIVRQSVRQFASDFIGKKISLQYENINEKIVTDEKWFAFVVEQILSNAVKYTKEGGVKIYKSDDNHLCIEDTGIGIAPEDLPRIFEKGYTGFNGRADKSASGIGLYLCKRVCGNLKMNITAKSEVGKGTVIMLDLNQNNIKHE
ncbi:MAG: sensor histidine kinase [Clostridia bacterium]|nr:sensor histidine kinase [Clostridia bacterium]